MGESLERLLTGKTRSCGTEVPARGSEVASTRQSLPARRNRGTQWSPDPATAKANMAAGREGTGGGSRPRPPRPDAHAQRGAAAPGEPVGRGLLGRKPRPLLGKPAGRGRAGGRRRGKERAVIGRGGRRGGVTRRDGVMIGCAEARVGPRLGAACQ